jgi:hypothetical protein
MTKKTPKPKFATREAWLSAFVEAVRPRFKEVGFPLPKNVRASIGFPSTGRRSKRIGECWSSESSADRHFEVFIHPGLQSGTSRVADIMTHELAHVACPGDGHGKKFRKCATSLGLTGKMTATVAGPEWEAWAKPILAELGPLPGADLTGASSTAPKKQSTRLLKVECSDGCGVVLRASAKVAGMIVGAVCPGCESGSLTVEVKE